MAKQVFAANALTGGVSGTLDDILHTVLENGNLAIVIDTAGSKTYFYKYDTTEAGAESSPDIIIPDSNSTGTGAWVLVAIATNDLDATGNVTIGGTLDVTGAMTAASLELGGAGAVPTEFSTDGTLAGDSDTAIPTEKAVKTYVDGLTATTAENLLINGCFRLWQRNTTQTSSAFDSDDRWFNGHLGTTKTHTRQTFTLGQTDVDDFPKYYSRTVVTSSAGPNNYCVKQQRIEDVTKFSGRTVTVSFWAKADASKNVAIEFSQIFGTGGSPSADVTGIGAQKIALTTSWAKYTATVAITSITGKTLGTDGNDYLKFNIWMDAGSSYNSRTDTLGQQSGTFEFSNVQIEFGSTATSFQQRTLQDELILAQRYYEKSYGLSTVPGTVTLSGAVYDTMHASTNTNICTAEFKTRKRGAPTITMYSTNSGTAARLYNVTTAGDVTISSTLDIGDTTWRANGLGAVQTVDDVITFQWTAESEL